MPLAVGITRKLEWDAGHRVLGHEGKCAHLHGHRYVAEVSVAANGLDELGRVVDFSVVKEVLGKWIDDNWDHNMMLHPNDPLCQLQGDKLEGFHSGGTVAGHVSLAPTFLAELFGVGKKPYIMPVGCENPTAENIAVVLFRQATRILPKNLQVVQIRVYETPNCWADACPFDHD